MHIRDERPHPSKVRDLLAGSCARVPLNECCSIIKSLARVSITLALLIFMQEHFLGLLVPSFLIVGCLMVLGIRSKSRTAPSVVKKCENVICPLACSGLSHESHRRDVEQIYLRCSQGSLEWLYPTGAIIVNLRPNTEPSSGHMTGLHVCIKPHTYSQVHYDTKHRE